MPVNHLASADEFNNFLKSENVSVVHFYAPWAEQCKHMNEVLEDLSKKESYKAVNFGIIEAEDLSELSLKYEVTAVPTVILIRNLNVIDRVNGANPSALVEKLDQLIRKSDNHTLVTKTEKSGDERLKELINKAKCMLFMKGDPETPRCGFSRTIIGILNSYNADYQTFDILQDNTVREGLKKFSNWPTYPQLYVDGELLGGLDIVKEMSESGELSDILPKKANSDQK